MSWRINTSQRRVQAEIMDDPDLDADVHRQALLGLERINSISRSAQSLWPAIRSHARAQPNRPLRVLDVACGGGDVTRKLWRMAQQAQVPLILHGCDVSPTALTHAREQAGAINARIVYLACDVLRDPLPDGYDVMLCTLFLHHLHDAAATTVLSKMALSSELVLVSDLVRSPLTLALAWLGTRLVTNSKVVHIDGPRSVQGAYTPSELRELARQADMHGAVVRRQFPTRMLLTWRRN